MQPGQVLGVGHQETARLARRLVDSGAGGGGGEGVAGHTGAGERAGGVLALLHTDTYG